MTIEKVKFAVDTGDSILITIDGEEKRMQVGEALLLHGLQDWLAAGNEIEPYLTILSAEYVNPEHEGNIRIKTVELGNVIARETRPFVWQALEEWIENGGEVGSYVDYGKEQREAAAAAEEQKKKREDLLDAMIEKGVTPETIKGLP